ncbi:MAG: hypothetical protein KGL57_06170 [Burkholderiales bacterium]|nr:hypothetical protein [Burkholderiales bacterium]
MLYSRVLFGLWCMGTFATQGHAMSSVSDADLHQVFAKDGVTIASELNIKLGSFTYLDSDTPGGAQSGKDVTLRGQYLQRIDTLSSLDFADRMKTVMMGHGASASVASNQMDAWVAAGTYDMAAEVTQIAFPDAGLDSRLAPTIHIGAVTSGNSSRSMGAVQLKNYDLQGTSTWSWRH